MLLNTLKKNKEFNFVYRRGKHVSSKDLTLIFVKSRYGGIRAGFSVSKKVGNSVIRNKTRRRLKEAVRSVLPQLFGNYSIIFVARPCIVQVDYAQIAKQVAHLLKKAGILTEGQQSKL